MATSDLNFRLESPDLDDREAYVGLRANNVLRVPHGYPTDDAAGNDEAKKKALEEEKPRILSELARVLARFSQHFPKHERTARDGFLQEADGQALAPAQEAGIGYAGVGRYLDLIRRLRDPRLLALVKAPGLTAQFDHRHIARNLERAHFLADGTPVFEHFWAPRVQMRHTADDLVGLACWMALDGLRLLFPEGSDREIGAGLRAEWETLAGRFADDHELPAAASLFSTKRAATLPCLQSALDACVRRNPPFSTEARALYHLLDQLLHEVLDPQQKGNVWGLKGFHAVWESACLEYAIARAGKDEVFTCDDAFLPGIDVETREAWKRNRQAVFTRNGIARRPDLVLRDEDGIYRIIDFKYYPEAHRRRLLEKRHSPPDLFEFKDKKLSDAEQFAYKAARDVQNLEAYRWLLAEHLSVAPGGGKIKLEIWLPATEASEEPMGAEWNGGNGRGFADLTLVRQPARTILAAYAGGFHLKEA